MTNRPDRRLHPRIAPKGAARLVFGDREITARVANLSRNGMYVSTKEASLDPLLAQTVQVALRLDGQEQGWLVATGRVARVETHGIAIAFDELSAEMVRVVQEMSGQSHAHLRMVSVVLIDGDAQRSAAMTEGFRAAGCAVLQATTPLEAIVRLGESSFEPDLIAIADAGGADDLRRFVEANHPKARLVAVGSDAASGLTSEWLSSEDPDSDLQARVLQVIGRPRRTRL